jgi:hypothetical protein
MWFDIKKREDREKKILGTHQNFDDDIISIIGKISIRRFQRHQKRSQTVTAVGHTSGSKTSEPQHLWTARMIQFVHRLWSFLVSLDLFHQDLLNDVDGVIILVSLESFHWDLYNDTIVLLSKFYVCAWMSISKMDFSISP